MIQELYRKFNNCSSLNVIIISKEGNKLAVMQIWLNFSYFNKFILIEESLTCWR